MKTSILMGLLCIVPIVTQKAYGCSRNLTIFFWSPIIDRVSGDCSFVGYQPNPSGIFFFLIIGIIIIGFIIWRKRK